MIAYNNIQDDMDRPLFGVSTRRERLVNLVIGLLTTTFVVFTLISSLVFPDPLLSTHRFYPSNILFAICIVLVCASLLQLIYWYRQGDLDPKFRKMIYFNSATIVLLCACANWYFIKVTAERNANSTASSA